MKVEWRNKEAFAQFADVLGVTSDSIMAASAQGDGDHFWHVFYTEKPTAESDEWVWFAVIWRSSEDGELIEVLRREKFRTLGQFQVEFNARQGA